MPRPDAPLLEDWLEVVDTELHLMRDMGASDVIVIAHSLGCVTWLQYVQKYQSPISIQRVLLVAPADPALLQGHATSFMWDFAMEDSAVHMNNTTIIASDMDVWLPRGVDATFGKPLGLTPIIWQGALHFSLSDGFGQWAGVDNWCNDANAELRVR